MRPLPDRQPHLEAREAMTAASKNLSRENFQEHIERCKSALSEATGHKYAVLTRSGSDAVFQVLSAISGSIMVPDQGIWKGTLNHCRELGISTRTVPTDLGLIDSETLKEATEAHCPKALFITSFAGYVAEQEVEALSKVCAENDVLLIEDASSSIGDKALAKGWHSDIIVGSSRTPKILALDSGGFITTSNEEIMERVRELNKTFIPDPVLCAGMVEELKNTPHTISRLAQLSEALKEALDNSVHKGKRGICAGILMENPKRVARNARRVGLVTQSERSILTTCPRYDRFLEKGVVVELKKLDVESIGEAEIEHIFDVLRDQSV